MEKFIKRIVGFRTNTKAKIMVALVYYGYCIFKIPSRDIVSSVIWVALPFIFFAIKDKSDAKKKAEDIKSGKIVEPTKPIEPNKPIVLTKFIKRTVIASIVVLLGLGMYSNSVQKKVDLVYATEQKAIAVKQAKIDAEAKKVSDAKALVAKKNADAQAVKDAETARLQAIEDKKSADNLAKAEAEAARIGYETGISYNQLARTPDKYVGEKVKFSGKVIQVTEGDSETDLRIAVGDDYDTILLVAYDPAIISGRVLENDEITIRGISLGVYTYESTMGGNITIPLVQVDRIN